MTATKHGSITYNASSLAADDVNIDEDADEEVVEVQVEESTLVVLGDVVVVVGIVDVAVVMIAAVVSAFGSREASHSLARFLTESWIISVKSDMTSSRKN